MIRVFVSGCYDIIHAGHVQFFEQARALGDHLTVCFAGKESLWAHRERKSSLPDEHKKAVLESLRMVDYVVMGECPEIGLDFKDHFMGIQPDILAVTTDDQYADKKRALCADVGARYIVLDKTPPRFEPISTTQIVTFVQAPTLAPVRVDFGGGWFDVPRLARPNTYIVNCAVSPMVSLHDWPYEKRAGLGGSGAWALLNGKSGVESEIDLGVGWQDPAVIMETGLCVWRSGPRPVLDFKRNGDFLAGRMALLWTGSQHDTPGIAENQRDYDLIQKAGATAREAVLAADIEKLAEGIDLSYQAQRGEGMDELPPADHALARKYCGGGWGGYAVYLFNTRAHRDSFALREEVTAIEPFTK